MYRQVFLVGLVLIMATAGVGTQYVKAGGPGLIGGPDVNFNFNFPHKQEQHGDTYEKWKLGPLEHEKSTHNPDTGSGGDQGGSSGGGGGGGGDNNPGGSGGDNNPGGSGGDNNPGDNNG
jgi:hypothetical protein